MDLGRIGLWHFLDVFPASIARAAAREIEHLGFKALWIPEALGREAFTHAGFLLGATERLIVATGIANVWARDAMAMAAAQKTLAEAYPGRFLLGIGVSHAPLVAGMRARVRATARVPPPLPRRHGRRAVHGRRSCRASAAGAGCAPSE